MKLNATILKNFTKHVLQEFPNEACGLVINNKYVPVPNNAVDPAKTFAMDPLHLVKAKAMGDVQAVLHSHPYDKFQHNKWPVEWPSTSDMESWMGDDIPWGIVSTCGEGISPIVWLDESVTESIEGREFIHGVNDCYSIIRDWYKLNKGITLPNFARGIEWWYAGKDLYDENFKAAGFEEIELAKATVGDCVMMKAASNVTNHCAVIVGPNQILHHMFNRLSGVDQLSKWNRCIVRAVRYKGTAC
jgi:cell wall-associated NlpC family hydrolase